MRYLGIVTGTWFLAMGVYAATHAERSPEGPAGHWLSFPTGRRVGGVLTSLVGTACVVGSLLLL